MRVSTASWLRPPFAWPCQQADGDGEDGRVMDSAEPVYSIIAPVFNEEETLPHFYARIVAVMEDVGEPFELILVDDGSRDASASIMRRLHSQDPRVRAVLLSRNFGHQYVITAGMDYARGQAVVIIDADLQD